VMCPETQKPVPLSPNWGIVKKDSKRVCLRLLARPSWDRCQFEIVEGEEACEAANPGEGTVKDGTGYSPWKHSPIDGDYIKAEAQAGRLGQQLYAVALKQRGKGLH